MSGFAEVELGSDGGESLLRRAPAIPAPPPGVGTRHSRLWNWGSGPGSVTDRPSDGSTQLERLGKVGQGKGRDVAWLVAVRALGLEDGARVAMVSERGPLRVALARFFA